VKTRQHLPEVGPVLQLALRDPNELEVNSEPLGVAGDHGGFSLSAVFPVLRNGRGSRAGRTQQGWNDTSSSSRLCVTPGLSIFAVACAAALGIVVGRRLAE